MDGFFSSKNGILVILLLLAGLGLTVNFALPQGEHREGGKSFLSRFWIRDAETKDETKKKARAARRRIDELDYKDVKATRPVDENASDEEKGQAYETTPFPNPDTEEKKKANRMRQLLDEGNYREAHRLARDLMDSHDRGVRHVVVGALGWLGQSAVAELAEMTADVDVEIAREAMDQLNDSIAEVSEERERCAEIIAAVKLLTDATDVDMLLMQLGEVSTRLGIETLCELISGGNEVVSECAREAYVHMTGGEEFVDNATAEAYIVHQEGIESGKIKQYFNHRGENFATEEEAMASVREAAVKDYLEYGSTDLLPKAEVEALVQELQDNQNPQNPQP